ncbi:MAG: hypothetical protein KY459_01780 [Acidobacteria bacterium]|nr:hypothetical protein [Acidobacteriota bacterium]
MRHIPARGWFVGRIDHRTRETIDLLYQSAFGTSHENRALEHAIEDELREIIRLLGVFSSLAGSKRRPGDRPSHLRVELEEAISDAVKTLEAIDSERFGVSAPSDSFETSPWESLLATWLVIDKRLESVLEKVEILDAEVRSRLTERLGPPSPSLDPYLLTQWQQA